MPAPVIALVFAHRGNYNYDVTSDLDTKRALRRVNKALEERYGYAVGTKFGDPRGKDSNGDDVLSYALCMTVPKGQTQWARETFWSGAGNGGWIEMCDGVGYQSKNAGRARFFALDVESGDEALNELLADITGEALTVAPVATPAAKGDDPFAAMDNGQLEALCAASGVEVTPGMSKDELMTAFMSSIETAPEISDPHGLMPDASDVEVEEPEATDLSDLTNGQLKGLCDDRGIAYKSKDNKAALIAHLS